MVKKIKRMKDDDDLAEIWLPICSFVYIHKYAKNCRSTYVSIPTTKYSLCSIFSKWLTVKFMVNSFCYDLQKVIDVDMLLSLKIKVSKSINIVR